jgi:hypothetical protein
MAKIQPSVLNLRYTVGEGITAYVDVSQSASIVNRRFYRQGINWVVAGFTVTSHSASGGLITLAKLPNTWAVSNSWHKIYAAWQKQQHTALKDAGAESTVAKYRDFKIFANAAHQAAGFAANLIPKDLANAEFTKGEWDATQIVIPNDGGVVGVTAEYNLHMVGPDVAGVSFGMISNYAVSRSVPHSPDPVDTFPASGMLSEMFNVGMEDVEVVTNAIQHNDELPYDQIQYPGGPSNAPTLELVHEIFFSASTLTTSNFVTKKQFSGTNLPCGLLEITNGVDTAIDVYLHLVPGPDRGYLTQKMQDM